jgi:response regulator RpfG family c-di-GMP phosphodiesterase
MNYKILIVDDEEANLRLLERLFRSQYTILTAVTGTEALEVLKQHDIALIISDQRMPVMTGIQFLMRAAEMRPRTVRIILTGYTDVNALVEAINSGVVYKYVAKPWANEDLQQTVKRGLQHYETLKSQHNLKQQNERLHVRLEIARQSIVKVFVGMLSIRDSNAPGHAYRTSNYAVAIGQRFDLAPHEIDQLSLSALLHEVLYISIPNDTLFKATASTEKENLLVKHNLEWGLQLLASIPDFEEIASVIRYQSNRWDGDGCPEDLSGERIPLQSRIIAVADAYDEMTMPHSLQTSRTREEAITHLQSEAGKKLDPEVVEIFCGLSIGPVRNIKAEGEIGLTQFSSLNQAQVI